MIGNAVAGLFGIGVPPVVTAYESIATVTVGSGGTATVTFSSIPATYKHLQIRYIAKSSNASPDNSSSGIRFNSDSGSNYTGHKLEGNGSTAVAESFVSQSYIFGNMAMTGATNANTFGVAIIDILDYANTNKNKTIKSFNGYDYNGGGQIRISSGFRNNTAAITSILLDNRDGNLFAQYSSFALYGIKGA